MTLADIYKSVIDKYHQMLQPIAAAPGNLGTVGTKSAAKKEAEDELAKNDAPADDTSTALSK